MRTNLPWSTSLATCSTNVARVISYPAGQDIIRSPIKAAQCLVRCRDSRSFRVQLMYEISMASMHRTCGVTLELMLDFSSFLHFARGEYTRFQCCTREASIFVQSLLTLSSIGMERYKLPAGRLATIFYRAEPKDITTEIQAHESDQEKGPKFDGDVPPISTIPSTEAQPRDISTHNGRTLVWKNLTLDLKFHGENKRLLDGLSG